MRKNQPLLRIVIILIVVNILSSYYYKRFDLTQDKRYTLSEAALQTIEGLDQPLLVEVLLEGNFPAEFKRLQHETRQLLEEFASQNRNIKYQFINPTEDAEHAEEVQWQLAELGILPAQVTVQDGSAMRQELIYPGQ
jgi:ABC-2 type transport system permease protein